MSDHTDHADLRAVLDDRAERLDTHRPQRVADVHARVRGVRRRRQGLAAGAAAAVVAAVVVGTTLVPGDDGPEPVGEVVGVRPPATLSSLGFGYDLSSGSEGGEGRTGIRLTASDEPRLVSWATSGDDDRVRVESDVLTSPLTVDSADFTDWVLVPEGQAASVTVSPRSGRAGLAVYELGEQRPAGYTAHGVTFRQTTDDGELLGAVVGAPGRTEVTTPTLTAPGGTVVTHYVCSAPSSSDRGDGVQVRVTIEAGESGGSCDDGPAPVDAAGGNSTSGEVAAGTDVTARIRVTRDDDGEAPTDSDVQIGYAVYDGSAVARGQGGFAETAESGGHRYRLSEVSDVAPGDAEVRRAAPAGDGPVLVVARVVGRRLSSTFEFAGSQSATDSSGGGSGSSDERVVSAGADVALTLGVSRALGGRGPQTLGPGQSASLAFYVRAD